MRKNVNTQKRF